uniref:Protein kinase domain-containing protein n=1 Tax=Hucho hucho TaxID=62062 RepID=A0A4W5QDR8_9TELE
VSPGEKETVNNAETRTLGRTEEQPLPDSTSEPQEVEEPNDTAGGLMLSFHELKKITGHFDERPVIDGGSRLGEGSFGTVYKGLINGKPVAVKKLLSRYISLEELNVQFIQEVHCLFSALLLEMFYSPPMSWYRRCLTALRTARGLDNLHSNNHVYRDDKKYTLTQASAMRSFSTVMTEKIVGTTITPKSNICSFGVVLLAILSGLLPVNENRDPKFLVSKQNNGSFLFSTRLSSSYNVVKSISLEQLGPEREADNMERLSLASLFFLKQGYFALEQ